MCMLTLHDDDPTFNMQSVIIILCSTRKPFSLKLTSDTKPHVQENWTHCTEPWNLSHHTHFHHAHHYHMLTHPYYFFNYKQLFPIKPKLNKSKQKQEEEEEEKEK
ncbi:hypothetical protein V8G54_021048 [Vigna mungo]|uniref:Uncharacterized protein n=1 Tax=Vigna mungo TaxID=3915 RepID=A0AAQ3NF33_VIGMU